MNDLERDLHELFERKARETDPSMLAPEGVLRRGRRRQVRTVATGAAASVLALAIVVAAVNVTRRPDVVMPVGQQSLPERITTIGGVPVTAPAGWTLVDDQAFDGLLGSSQSCSFSGSGTAVDQDGSPVAASPVDASAVSSNDCQSTPAALPAGLPVLQLTNFPIPVTQTVCDLGDQAAPATVPNDGVAVYIGTFPAGLSTPTFQSSCPGSENIDSGVSVMTFADQNVQLAYGAIVLAGTAAPEDDIAFAQAYLESLDGFRVNLTGPSSPGLGLVIAAGGAGDNPWRLEASLNSVSGGDFGATLVTPGGDVAGSQIYIPAGSDQVFTSAADLGTDGMLHWGTAGDGVTGVDIVAPDGAVTKATMFAWPSVGSFPAASSPTDGSVWYAITAGRAVVRPVLASSPTSAPEPTEPFAARRLTASLNADGVYTISGNDLGHDWSIQQERGTDALLLSLDGAAPDVSRTFVKGSSTQIDVPGGTFILGVEPTSLRHLYVTSDVEGTDVIAEGRWAPSAPYAKMQATIWVVALPGAGSGFHWEDDRTLPTVIDWPTSSTPVPGDYISAGSTDEVSWAMYWSEQGFCPMLQVVASVDNGDTGFTRCPVPWNAQDYPHEVSYVGGVYGQHHAVVLITGPDNMFADVTAASDPQAGGTCGGSIANVGDLAHTGGCVFVIPVGDAWTIQPTRLDGSAFGKPITISASPGSIDIRGPVPNKL